MMVLYSGSTDPFSQRCRFVLFEKGMDFEIRDIDLYHKPEDINVMNPYGEVPILVERDLVLYESNIINEYIDERFPHPQLMPPDPVERARTRLLLFNLEREIFKHVHTLENRASSDEARVKAREAIRDQLTGLAPAVAKKKYLMGDEFSMEQIEQVGIECNDAINRLSSFTHGSFTLKSTDPMASLLTVGKSDNTSTY